MPIVGGFEVHRTQMTFDYLDTASGEVTTGQIRPATREVLRSWLERFRGRADVAFAAEGCTGWRFVVEELQRAGIEPHLAERLRPRRGVAPSSGRRPIVPTRDCCGSCSWSVGFRWPGSRRPRCWRCARWGGCT